MEIKTASGGYIILLTQKDIAKLIRLLRWYEPGTCGWLFFRTKNGESVVFGEEVPDATS